MVGLLLAAVLADVHIAVGNQVGARGRNELQVHHALGALVVARVGARRLMLTHLVPAPMPEQYPEWKAIAAEYFDGEIVIGDDLTAVTLTAESE